MLTKWESAARAFRQIVPLAATAPPPPTPEAVEQESPKTAV
jgi:hypothetical protein